MYGSTSGTEKRMVQDPIKEHMENTKYRLPDCEFTHELVRPSGGQQINNTPATIMVTHVPSGNSVTCNTTRSQVKNARIARLTLEAMILDSPI